MRGRMSFVGAVARGLLVFTMMTASLAVALFLAITGPPSNDEMRGLRVLADQAAHQFESGAGRLGASICAQLPPKVKPAAGCRIDGAPVMQAKAEPPPAMPLPPDITVPQPPVQIAEAQTQADDARLLGADAAASVPVVLEQVRVRAVAPRHARARAAHGSRVASRHPAQRISSHPRAPSVPSRHTTSARTLPEHTPPHVAPAHATPVVAVPPPPPPAESARAVPHPQRAAPEPQVADAPASAAPVDDSASEDAPQDDAADPPPEKQDPAQAQTF